MEEIVLTGNQIIVFNKALIHAGGMAGKMTANWQTNQLFQILSAKMTVKNPEGMAAELSIQLSFGLFGSAYEGAHDPENAHPLWVKDEKKISNNHQSNVDVQ